MYRRQQPDRHGDPVSATIDLVAPLPGGRDFWPSRTAMRVTDIASDLTRARSGAVSQVIGESLRSGDVDSANQRSTPITAITPGIRTSTTATRTTTTRTTVFACVPSADESYNHPADLSLPTFADLVQAYFDCREHKRNSLTALAFEQSLERNLAELYDELIDGSYRIGRSICFVITHPKPREVWAAAFRDRIVHHLLYNRVAKRFLNSFIADSCACIPARGTLYAAERLESKVRSITQNWQRPAFYLKCDLANFFVSIDKTILRDLLAKRIVEPWWMALCEQVLFHDPRTDVDMRGRPQRLSLIPHHKSLFNHPPAKGLPIGNLSSQFFANVYLDLVDQHIKHVIGARHYIRYVDDMVLLHDSAQWLNAARIEIERVLAERLALRLNPSKTILQPITRGIDFVGQVIKPWRRTTRRRTVKHAMARIGALEGSELFETANSYFGLFRQASHSHADRARFAKRLLMRGRAVDGALTKVCGKQSHA